MKKITIRGVKKLFGLTKTKIRLAKEADTKQTKPKPLPLIKLLSRCEIETVEHAEKYLGELKEKIEYSDEKNTAKTVLELMDIIEGVKYKFEPVEFIPNINKAWVDMAEKIAKETSTPLNLLLMTENAPENPAELNLFIGYNMPKNATFLSRVPTSITPVLNYCFNSRYFSMGRELKNLNILLGHRTLILNAIYFALMEFGAEQKK